MWQEQITAILRHIADAKFEASRTLKHLDDPGSKLVVDRMIPDLEEAERLLKTLHDSPSEPVNSSYSGDLEFHVPFCSGVTEIYEKFDDAAVAAMNVASAHGEAHIDVIIWNEDGARKYGGDDAVDQYNEDPDASVFERLQVRFNNQGRVP